MERRILVRCAFSVSWADLKCCAFLMPSRMENTEEYKGIKIVRFEYMGYPAVKIFKAGKDKPFVSRYGPAKRVEDIIANCKSDADKKMAEDERKKAYKPNMKAGDILESSWGYDQTNIDFYQVTRVSGTRAYMRKIGKKYVQGEERMCEDAVMPDRGNFCGGEFFKRICVFLYGNEASEYVNISSYSTARPWNGQVRYETNAMYGH